MKTRLRLILFALSALALLSAFAPQLNAQRGGAQVPQAQAQIEMTDGPTIINGVDVSRLQFRYVGPPGNRVSAVVSPPGNKQVYYAGAASGGVFKSTDGGVVWKPVFDKQQSQSIGANDGIVSLSRDGGKTWKALGAGIPKSVFSYVRVVREDPTRKGLLYAGTENGLYVSHDDGATWASLQLNLPHVSISWIEIQPTYNDLVIGTSGRGCYILVEAKP